MARKGNQAVRQRQPQFRNWQVFIVGVLVGLALAALVFYKGWYPTMHDRGIPQPDILPAQSAPAAVENEAEKAPIAFTFYDKLTDDEARVSDSELTARVEPEHTPASAAIGALFLQVGSFKTVEDAERMKAQLSLLGLRAQIATADINGVSWNRVRLGPYVDTRELEQDKSTLSANQIQAIALRAK